MRARLRTAKFKEAQACIEDIDYDKSRGLKKSEIIELAQKLLGEKESEYHHHWSQWVW